MQFKHKLEIDFKEFFVKGKFDFLKIGQTKEWIINNFPDPDDADQNDLIWRYGNIELYFQDNKLSKIYSDYIKELDGGSSLQLNKWFLKDVDNLQLREVIALLNKEHIDYKKETYRLVDQVSVHLRLLPSQVLLGFGLSEKNEESMDEYDRRTQNTDQGEFELYYFQLS